MQWQKPWTPAKEFESRTAPAGFEAELQREVKPGHPLFGLAGAAIGRAV